MQLPVTYCGFPISAFAKGKAPTGDLLPSPVVVLILLSCLHHHLHIHLQIAEEEPLWSQGFWTIFSSQRWRYPVKGSLVYSYEKGDFNYFQQLKKGELFPPNSMHCYIVKVQFSMIMFVSKAICTTAIVQKFSRIVLFLQVNFRVKDSRKKSQMSYLFKEL